MSVDDSLPVVAPHDHRVITIEGGELEGCEVDGVWYVAMPRACRRLRLSWHGQLERLKRDPILRKGIRVIRIPSAGGDQETVCLRLDLFWGWLFKLELSRLEPDVQEQIMPLQEAGYQALHERFTGVRHGHDDHTLSTEIRAAIAEEVRRQLAQQHATADTSAPPEMFRQITPADVPPALYTRLLGLKISTGARLFALQLLQLPADSMPTQDELAAMMQVDSRTIWRWVRKLREAGFLVQMRNGRRVVYRFRLN